MAIRILHLTGSPTSEFYCDVSRIYARDCLQAIANLGAYDSLIAYVTPDRRWRFPQSLSDRDISAAAPMELSAAIRHLSEQAIDVALPQMFCIRGMTDYRALLNLLQIPYVGNEPALMAIAADKSKAKAIVAAAGVKVPAGKLLRRGDRPTLFPSAFPRAIVKPNNADNSLGISLVNQFDDYSDALTSAFAHSDEVLVEQFIELGREVRCGIVAQGERLICLPLQEYHVDPVSRPFRNQSDKLIRNEKNVLDLASKGASDGGARSWMVEADDPDMPEVWEAAKRCHRALGCRHYSLFDFRIDPQGQPWFLEAGPYCSFAPKSVVVLMMEAAGVPLDDFFEMSINQAIGRQTNGIRCAKPMLELSNNYAIY